MPTVSPRPSSPSFTLWGVALAASSLMMIGGGIVIWTHQAPPATPPDVAIGQPMMLSKSIGPLELPDMAVAAGLHSVSYSQENGTKVVKIRVSPNGDELIVDAHTGRLIEARPAANSAVPVT